MLFILFCCIVVLATAYLMPRMVGNAVDSQSWLEELNIPLTMPQIEPIALPTLAAIPTPLPISPNGDVETQIYANVYERVNPSVVAILVLDEEALAEFATHRNQPLLFPHRRRLWLCC